MTVGRRVRLLALATIVVATATLPAGAAGADPLADAKAQAAHLQQQVTALRVQAEQATERYDAAEAQMGELVGQEVAARRSAADAQHATDQAQQVAGARARALYMSGGMLGIYASVLDGSDPARLLAGLHDVQTMSLIDARAVRTVSESRQRLAQAQQTIATLVQRQNDAAAEANAARLQVEQTLAEQQQALAAANDQVKTIEAQIEAQLAADNAARASAALVAAREAALQGGFSPGQPSQAALTAIAAAESQLGKPYVYGGSGPDTWDCSGLTQFAYRLAGVGLPRTAAEQYLAVATKVPLGELQAGDLLFWATNPADPNSIHHVAIYLGNAQMIAAPHTGTVVQIQPVYLDGYYGAVRPS